ncbi:hypothetical protein K439DRAFT_1324957 [Ramaria rubella]|nr:hypothetical protein K439DRAFT_1324957 [Ramaria rubella]
MLRTVKAQSSLRRYRATLSSRHSSSSGRTASAQLWADAEKEDLQAENINSTQATLKPGSEPPQHPNWTGDESVQDAVLRMLLDKYKPLRGGSIVSAEEKLKAAPPPLRVTNSLPPSSPSAEGDATDKPWLTTYRIPSHATSIRYMRLPPISPPSALKPAAHASAPIHPDDTRARIQGREQRKQAAFAGRLTKARESSLDYRIGKPLASAVASHPHPNPVSIKGWTSLVEERIESARRAGHFRALKGRGKPLVRETEQSNPFIPREEFLMNRIVQRQGAAPPWVELQGELDAAVNAFRSTLRATWTRRAVRTLMLDHPPGLSLPNAMPAPQGMRDTAWETREKAYHEAALGEINALVRKYNGVAPYVVRRTYLTREAELERMYEACGEDILVEVRRRIEAGAVNGAVSELAGEGEGAFSPREAGKLDGHSRVGFGLGEMWRRWVARWVRW